MGGGLGEAPLLSLLSLLSLHYVTRNLLSLGNKNKNGKTFSFLFCISLAYS